MQIHSLSASTGAVWLRDGWRLLKRQPLALAAMVVMYSFALLVPATIPFVGLALLGVLSPFATLGLMAACREAAAGRAPTPAVFAQPLQDAVRRKLLFRLGVIHAGLLLVVSALANLLVRPVPLAPEDSAALDGERLVQVALLLLLYSPVMVAMWFAPMLSGWHGLAPGKAMFGSAVACWRNKGAMLVYGLLMTAVLTGVSFLAVALLGALLSSTQVLSMLLAPVGLALMTFVQASFYPMYRSIFTETPAEA
jgi:hypothetical protein